MAELLNTFSQATGSKSGKAARDQVELLVASVGHQLFGLLMSQVINIVRPSPAGLEAISLPAPFSKRPYSEIFYQTGRLRVLELSRQLLLPLVEPIERSQVLLVGWPPYSTFGVAVDDIATVRRVNLRDIRVLPQWIYAGRSGNLVWGAVLVEPESLTQDSQTSALPQPFQPGLEPAPLKIERLELPSEQAETSSGGAVRPRLNLAERLARREQRVEVNVDKRRPLLLLDLHALNAVAWPEKT